MEIIHELQLYLNTQNPSDLAGASLRLIGENSRLVYRAQKDSRLYIVSMDNPKQRAKEEISVAEEYALRERLPKSMGPIVYHLDQGFRMPFIVTEFILAPRLAEFKNDHQPLSPLYVTGAARAIAKINAEDITPARFSFLKKERLRSFRRDELLWYRRLGETVGHSRNTAITKWVLRIFPLAFRAGRVLSGFNGYFAPQNFSFHLNRADAGTIYWRNDCAIFSNWRDVSYTNDPTSTLMNFAVSVGTKGGIVSEELFNLLVGTYLTVRPLSGFRTMARARLLERQVSKLVEVLWVYSKEKDAPPLEQVTNILQRYDGLKKSLETFS